VGALAFGGQILQRMVYDPYGQAYVRSPDYGGQDPSTYKWNYFHQGLRLDTSVNLYDNRARMYSPTLMRFLQNDPLGYGAGDANTYRYEGNGPTGGSDPSGEDDGYVGFFTSGFRDQILGLNQPFGGPLDENGNPTLSSVPVEKPGLARRVSERILENTVLAPRAISLGLFDSYSTLREKEGASPLLAGAATPFLFVARAIEGFWESLTRVVIGEGTAEDYVDLGLAAAPFLPKVGRAVGILPEGYPFGQPQVGAAGFEPYGVNPKPGTRIVPNGIPETWRIAPTDTRGGVWYYDPANKGNAARVMQGNPSSPFPNSQAPYVRWQLNGHPLDVNGNVLSSKFAAEAHIPLEQFQFNPDLFRK
jgi:RHS repeat-associated protein